MEKDEEEKQFFTDKKSLGDRMKEYEFLSRTSIDEKQPAILRIDGHGFSKFTKGLKKPYDDWLHKIMVTVTTQLVNDFNGILGYTQSDEITIILLPHILNEVYQPYIFAGQVQKLVSLSAANATNIFTNELRSMIDNGTIILSEYSDNVQKKLKYPRSYFDARIFNVPNNTECFNNVFWRSTYDCTRNSVNSLAHVHYNQKIMQGISTKDLKEKLLKEKNINWNDLDPEYKYGTFVKKKLIKKVIIHLYISAKYLF